MFTEQVPECSGVLSASTFNVQRSTLTYHFMNSRSWFDAIPYNARVVADVVDSRKEPFTTSTDNTTGLLT